MLSLFKSVIEKLLFCMKELRGLMFTNSMASLQSLHSILITSSPNFFFYPPPPSFLLLPQPLIQSDHEQRYGAAAGQATDHAVNSAINVGLTAFNVDNLGIKAVVKRTGKQTAKAILDDYNLPEKPTNGKQLEKAEK